MAEGYQALTEKEKETLRLIVRGHDAKSMARQLDLSVHTINERLRAARRKLAVTSSREAARLVLDREGRPPELLEDNVFGEASGERNGDHSRRSLGHQGDVRTARHSAVWLVGGISIMSLLVAFLALSSPQPVIAPASHVDARPAEVAAADAALEAVARDWLELADAGDWRSSYEATGSAFRRLNTLAAWERASLQARAPLGRVLGREAITFENVPAPPEGYAMIRFRTDFANRAGATETLTLAREEGRLKVVGYIID